MTKEEYFFIPTQHEYQHPVEVNEIFQDFIKINSSATGNAKLLEKVLSAREYHSRDESLYDMPLKLMKSSAALGGRQYLLDLYINFMGRALWLHSISNNDAAWFYYAKAQKELGSYLSWDHAMDHLAVKDNRTVLNSKAARDRHIREKSALINPLIEIVQNPPRKEGWKSKEELIEKALCELEKIHVREKILSPLFENLERFIRRQIKNPTEAGRLFFHNYDGDPSEVFNRL